jgi:hypothetical protein
MNHEETALVIDRLLAKLHQYTTPYSAATRGVSSSLLNNERLENKVLGYKPTKKQPKIYSSGIKKPKWLASAKTHVLAFKFILAKRRAMIEFPRFNSFQISQPTSMTKEAMAFCRPSRRRQRKAKMKGRSREAQANFLLYYN